MYEIALTVASCLQAGTRADVAWLVETNDIEVDDWSSAVMFTPGGGRVGSIAEGAADGALADLAGRIQRGRLIELEISQVDALVSGFATAGSVSCLLVPATQFPDETWDLASKAVPFCIVCSMDGDEVESVAVFTPDNIEGAPTAARDAFSTITGSRVDEGLVTSVFRAVPQMVLVGDHPVIQSLAALADVTGWAARPASSTSEVAGVIATLSALDMIVVAAHDLELAGSALMAALQSDVGYIGALGSRRMQETRAEWLAYRGVTDLERVQGPAGLDIGAETPPEIAVSILAQAIASRSALDAAIR